MKKAKRYESGGEVDNTPMTDYQRMNKKYYEGQTSRLPSQDALESNKGRQNREMKSAVKEYVKGVMPGGAAGMALEKIKEAKRIRDVNAKGGRKFQIPDMQEGYKSGGSVSASKRADGCATKGKTRGKMV